MLTYEEIMNYCSNYKIDKGIVIDKNTNQQVIDEDIILKVKSSVLLFKEAKEDYQYIMRLFGKTDRNQEYYIKKAMEKFGVNNEQNGFGINKLVNGILSSNGHYEEMMFDDDLQLSKFSILVAPKNEYGIAYLRLKFREKGLDIEDLKVSKDISELESNGLTKVIIDFKIKKYEKVAQNVQNNILQSSIHHPRAQELNELERQKQIAKQNNDKVAYNQAQKAIEKIILESRMTIEPGKWDLMSDQEKLDFMKIKMNESKVLHDQDEFNYWNANFKSLNEKINSQSEIKANNESLPNGLSIHHPRAQELNELERQKQIAKQNNDKAAYNQAQKAIKKIVWESGMEIEPGKWDLMSNQEKLDFMKIKMNESKVLNDQDEFNFWNANFKYLNEEINSQSEIKSDSNKKTKPKVETDLTTSIKQLRDKMNKVHTEYKYMFSDRYIDNEELAVLMHRTSELIDDAYSLKSKTNNQKEVMILNQITEKLENEQNKMQKFQRDPEDLARRL